jgi:hypothetical protein
MRSLLRDWDTWLLWALVASIALAAAGMLGATLDAIARAAS